MHSYCTQLPVDLLSSPAVLCCPFLPPPFEKECIYIYIDIIHGAIKSLYQIVEHNDFSNNVIKGYSAIKTQMKIKVICGRRVFGG
jgi:hypothetical protein